MKQGRGFTFWYNSILFVGVDSIPQGPSFYVECTSSVLIYCLFTNLYFVVTETLHWFKFFNTVVQHSKWLLFW